MPKQFTQAETERILEAVFNYRQAAIDKEGKGCNLINVDDVSLACYAIDSARITDFENCEVI